MANAIATTRRGNPKDLAGVRFGRLIAVEPARNSSGKRGWRCQCDCGGEIISITSNLRNGHTESCGCLRREMTSIRCKTHGRTKGPEYQCWAGMLRRCFTPSVKSYQEYGARGITVCDEWANSFEAFCRDMGPRPSRSHSIDRYPDPNGNYEPSNCRWGTPQQQANNRRSNRFIEFRGETLTLAELSHRHEMKLTTLWARLKSGWTIEKALTTPVRVRKT